ncbi:hypothetical protein HDK64DRAFT_79965 [Phyllosticta capitalensis]
MTCIFHILFSSLCVVFLTFLVALYHRYSTGCTLRQNMDPRIDEPHYLAVLSSCHLCVQCLPACSVAKYSVRSRLCLIEARLRRACLVSPSLPRSLDLRSSRLSYICLVYPSIRPSVHRSLASLIFPMQSRDLANRRPIRPSQEPATCVRACRTCM